VGLRLPDRRERFGLVGLAGVGNRPLTAQGARGRCSKRAGRAARAGEINARFAAYRDALGLPPALRPHSLRHSYVTHLTEDGADRRFIQVQVGHECDSSTAIYTHVSDDFMNRALRRALPPALGDDWPEHGRDR
jgi:integrase/recombinase XerC